MTPYPLHRSETSTKVMITLFLLFMVGSFSVAFLNVYDKVGRVPNGVALRYGPDKTDNADVGTAPAITSAPADGIYGSGPNENTGENTGAAAPVMVARMNTFSALVDL